MGQVTPNIGIYIPSAGETNYDASFAVGMFNIDQHDHSGGPTGGVPISSAGLETGSVTYDKLNANVADNTKGIGTNGTLGANQLALLGLPLSLFTLGGGGGQGFLTMNGTTASKRTILGTANQIDVANGTGTANPVLSLSPTTINSTQPAFLATADTQNNVTGDGTDYTVLFVGASGYNFDQSANFTSPSFTCPETGVYIFDIDISMGGIGAAHTLGEILININGSNDFTGFNANLAAIANSGNGAIISTTQIIKLTAGDIVQAHLRVSNGTKVISILDGTFSGALLY